MRTPKTIWIKIIGIRQKQKPEKRALLTDWKIDLKTNYKTRRIHLHFVRVLMCTYQTLSIAAYKNNRMQEFGLYPDFHKGGVTDYTVGFYKIF